MSRERFIRQLLHVARNQYVGDCWQNWSKEGRAVFMSLTLGEREDFDRKLTRWIKGGPKARFPDVGVLPAPGADGVTLNGEPIMCLFEDRVPR